MKTLILSIIALIYLLYDRFSDYGRLYYEKQLPLGFKCMKLIKSDVSVNAPINQEEIYNIKQR